jgi:hypothetical protein
MFRKRRLTGKTWPLFLLILMIGACASAPKMDRPQQPVSAAPLIQSQSDTALFQQSITLLGAPGKPADYDKARASFDQLIRLFPKSKWRPYADSYLKLLDELKANSDKAMADRLAARKAKTETDDLRLSLDQSKKAHRLLQEKMQTDMARVQQENEQLKNDIQRLKQLEVDLQRRERSLK